MSFDRKQHLPLILGAAVFLLGGFDALQNGALFVGLANLLAGLLNVAAVALVRTSPRTTAVALNLLNAAVAGVMVLTSVRSGKQYIQYAWGLTVVFFLGAAVVAWRARRPGGSAGTD